MRGLALAAAAIGLAGLAACGTEEEEPARIAIVRSEPAQLDPALATSEADLEAVWLVYTPLLSYRHEEGEDGSELLPGLASDLPEVSGDGRTYELALRERLEYSDGTPVEASDFEHAVMRARELGSPGTRHLDGIARIDADDETGEIRIRLRAPDPEFPNVLALTYAAPVPGNTPVRDLADEPPPGVGPYEVAAVEAGGFSLEQSEGFEDLDLPDIPTGSVDRIDATVEPSARRQAEAVLAGRADYMAAEPPARGDRPPGSLIEHPLTTTSVALLDPAVPPFDEADVREAVNLGIDRPMLASRLAPPSLAGCSLIPPGIAGYDEGLDRDGCPYGDPLEEPGVEAAGDLVERAGAAAARVTVAYDRPSLAPAAGAFASMLAEIGLDAEARPATRSPEAGVRITTLSADLPHPVEFLAPAADLGGPPIGDEGEADPSELNRRLVAPPGPRVAAFAHGAGHTLFSKRMDSSLAVFHPVYGDDYSSWDLDPEE